MRRTLLLLVVLAMVAASCTNSGESVSTTTSTTVAEQDLVEPPTPPQIIPLLATTSDASTTFGQTIFLNSKVMASEPITSLELLVDGEMVDRVEFDTPIADPDFSWKWIPGATGLQTAVVRAYDESGEAADSFPTWFRVNPGTDAVTGEQRRGLPVADGSPEVSVDLANCQANFEVAPAGDQLGQYVVASSFGVTGYHPVAVLPAQGGPVTIPMTASPVLVSVSSYDENLATPGGQLMVPGEPECATGNWEGEVSFDGPVLIGGEGMDAAYLYLTEDDVNWRRVPETGFLTPGPGGFDFSGALPTVPSGGHLEVEVWGRDNGALKGLGRGRFTTDSGGPAETMWGGGVQFVEPYSLLHILNKIPIIDTSDYTEELLLNGVICPSNIYNPECGSNPRTVRWDSGLTGASAGLVQVSSAQPPSGAALNFPGLLWSDEIALDGESVRDVELPLQAIVDSEWIGASPVGDTVSAQVDSLKYSDLEAMAIDLSQFAQPAPSGDPARMSKPVTFASSHGPPTRLWVRVVPLVNDKPVAGMSNSVLYRVDHEALQLAPDIDQVFNSYYDTKVEFTQPQRGNMQFARCVRVVENPFGKENPVPNEFPWNATGTQTWQGEFNVFRDWAGVWTPAGKQATGLIPGATSCARHPDPPDDDFFDFVGDAISFIGNVWDTFKDMVDMIKGGIIQGIVDITGCKPESTCVAALTALADAGLAAVGVPPTLPSFSEFIEAAKGDIAGALAEQLIGQSCGAIPCQQFAEEFIADAINDIQEHFSEMTVSNVNSGGWELWLNPAIVVVPEPAGQLFPGSVKVTITRKDYTLPSTPAPGSCLVSLVTDGSGFLDWAEKGGLPKHANDPVQGVVFASESKVVDLSTLTPGQSLTVGLSGLDFDRFSYLKGTEPYQAGFASEEKLKSLALFYDIDTTLTMTANVCGKPYQESAKLKAVNTTPADIPTN